jgi:hypothetical protein
VGTTVMLTALEQHVKQDSQCSIIKNVEGTVEVIRLGLVLITLAIANQISLFQMDCATIVLMVVVYVLDWAVFSVRTVLIEHGRYNQH